MGGCLEEKGMWEGTEASERTLLPGMLYISSRYGTGRHQQRRNKVGGR
jgi:hypothetical protein